MDSFHSSGGWVAGGVASWEGGAHKGGVCGREGGVNLSLLPHLHDMLSSGLPPPQR